MKTKKLIIELMGTVIGSFIMAIAVSLFLLPNQLSSGGIAGIRFTNGNCHYSH